MGKRIWNFALLAVALTPALFGQSVGGIVGDVRDGTGAVVAGANVTVTNTGTNAARTMQSNEVGMFSFPALPPGPYTIRVETPGFRPSARSLDLQVQQTARVDFALEVGQVTESIEVSALAAQLNTENATVGTVIDQKRITDLPLNGRNFMRLVALSPNVTSGFGTNNQNGRQGGDRMNQQISVAGARPTSNNYTLDGVGNTDVNFNTYVILPSIDMLQEFKVQTGVYPAEFGRAASQVNVSTRSGTNNFHGAVYEFVRNDKMDARTYDFTAADHLRVKNPFQWNQYGFTFGGPVVIPKVVNGKNRLFFISNYEFFRQRARPVDVYSLPTALMRQGNFSELNVPLYDPVGRSRDANGRIVAAIFPGNIIPLSRQSFQTKALYEFAPVPNGPSEAAAGQAPLRNYRQASRSSNDKDQFHLRLDWIESAKSTWYGRYSWSDENEINARLYQNGEKIISTAKQYMINNTRTFTPTAINEFRFGINTLFNVASGELAYVRDVLSELKIPGANPAPEAAWGAPSVTSIPGISGWGGGGDPFEIRNAAFQAVDTFSLIRGKHSYRFGGEVRRDRFNTIGNQFLNPEFQFNGTMTRDPNAPNAGGSGIADYFLGYTSNPRYAVSPAFLQLRGTSYAMFIDDVWRIRPNLTVNFGLRYEYVGPYTDRAEKLANIYMPHIQFGTINIADQNLHPTMIRSGSTGGFYDGLPFRYPNVKVARDGRMGESMINGDKNDFAPRFGIAWNPNSKWSIRTGAGLFYSAEVANTKFDLARTLGGRRDGNTPQDFPTFTVENFLGNTGTLQLPNPWTWAIDPNIKSMYMFQYLFNVQRELSSSLMLEVGYMGSLSRKLTGLYDPNQSVLSGAGTAAATRAPFPEFGIIQTIHGNGRGNYNSTSLKLTKRFSGGLTALIGYTYSKSIDTASAWRGAGDSPSANDATCYLDCERSVSGFNIPQRTVISLLYELPFGKGKQFGSSMGAIPNAIVGGWQISSIASFQSGRTTNVTGGRNSVAYQDGQRPSTNGQRITLPDDERTLDRWFNTSSVVTPALGVMGNIGRNVVIGPRQQSWDFSAHKAFRVIEGHSLTFRVEAFNFANHPVFGRPSVGVGTGATAPATFGQIRSVDYPMRQIQLGLKYIF